MKPLGVVLHITASTFGDVAEVTAWHKERGFQTVGYHVLILNGRAKSKDAYHFDRDGEVQAGRAKDQMGAHCKAGGMNQCTFGVAAVADPAVPAHVSRRDTTLSAKGHLTKRQAAALVDAVAGLCLRYGWNPLGTFKHPATGKTCDVISQHSTHDSQKPFCASLHLDAFRWAVKARMDARGPNLGMGASEAPVFREMPDAEMDEPDFDIPSD